MHGSLVRIWTVAQLSGLEMYRRKDVYVVGVLSLIIIIPLLSLNLFGVAGIFRYLSEISLLLIWLFSIIIAISTAARQIPSELERRTIFPLLSKPIRRKEIVLGKFLGSFTATGTCLIIFYLLFALLSGAKQGTWITPCFVQALMLHLVFVALLSSMVIAGSLCFSASANITLSSLICVGMLLFGQRLPVLAEQSPIPLRLLLSAMHYAAPHFELLDLRLRLVHEWPPLNTPVLVLVMLYGLSYSAVFLCIASALFQRKQV